MASMAERPWIDVHAHFSLPSTPEQREKQREAMQAVKFYANPVDWTAEATIEYMDEAGVQMQMLSVMPKTLEALRATNDYAASLVEKYPTRFGLLAAIPTNDAEAGLEEVERATSQLNCDGFAVTCCYNGVYLGDKSLDALWAKLNDLKATIFCHPDAYLAPPMDQPTPLVEVAFETTRCFVDMLYAGVFRRFPDIKWIVAHCGGCLPALSGRIKLLGTAPWVGNPNKITNEEIQSQLSNLFLDTAATMPTGLVAALCMVPRNHIVYGTDCGVPCSTSGSMEQNKQELLKFEGMTEVEREAVGTNVLKLLPKAAKRLGIADVTKL